MIFTILFPVDPEDLIVTNHDHNIVIGRQYEPFVIPCRPTSPNVKVELIKEDGEVKELSYNATHGFLVVSSEPFQGGFLDCNFFGNVKNDSLPLIVNVDRRFHFQNLSKKHNMTNIIIEYLSEQFQLMMM